MAKWTDENSYQFSKFFGSKKYGNAEACTMVAIEHQQMMISQFSLSWRHPIV